MKNCFYILLAMFGLSLTTSAKDATYPKAEPVISLAVPEGWETEWEDDLLYLRSDEDDSVVVEVSALKATKQEGAKALEEMKTSVQQSFKNMEWKPMQEGGSNNVGIYILNGKGEDEQGKANINAVMVTNGDNDKLFMVFIAASPEGSEKFGTAIDALLKSLKKI
jgi:dGTP triphosphohydrolase